LGTRGNNNLDCYIKQANIFISRKKTIHFYDFQALLNHRANARSCFIMICQSACEIDFPWVFPPIAQLKLIQCSASQHGSVAWWYRIRPTNGRSIVLCPAKLCARFLGYHHMPTLAGFDFTAFNSAITLDHPAMARF
jgi:hypothetical protein